MNIWTLIKKFFSWIKNFGEPGAQISTPVQTPTTSNGNKIPLTNAPIGTPAWYKELWGLAKIDPEYLAEAAKAARIVLVGKSRYQTVSEITNVPWWVIGVIHWRESSCDFKGILHNGEKILGSGKKTKLVPKGRGPFSTWEEAAIDALEFDGVTDYTQWDLWSALKKLELYNGPGYLKYHQDQLSSYLWSYTTIDKNFGRYAEDGKYDESQSTNDYSGIVPILMILLENKQVSIEMP